MCFSNLPDGSSLAPDGSELDLDPIPMPDPSESLKRKTKMVSNKLGFTNQ